MSGRFNGFSQDEIHSIHRGIDGRPIKKAKPRAPTSNVANNNKNVHQSKSVDKVVKADEELYLNHGNDGPCDASNESNETVPSLQDALYFKPLPSDQRQFDEIDLNGDEPTSTTPDDETSNGQQSSQHTARSIYQGVSLKDFDSHRQMIEESNKEKKQILARALDERWDINLAIPLIEFLSNITCICFVRFEQTTAEAKKIAEVKEELQKLDAELAADVTILRKEIEAAALSYAHYKYVWTSNAFKFIWQNCIDTISERTTIESNLNFWKLNWNCISHSRRRRCSRNICAQLSRITRIAKQKNWVIWWKRLASHRKSSFLHQRTIDFQMGLLPKTMKTNFNKTFLKSNDRMVRSGQGHRVICIYLYIQRNYTYFIHSLLIYTTLRTERNSKL